MRFAIGDGLSCDLDILVGSRLLVQANSGAGKSWCLRRILEQTHGHVQHLVIDPEGEFSSLREKFDYVLAARHGGDTTVDPRAAKLLAERLLELKASAVLDIYELKHDERIRFVRLFLEALVDSPKKLWHPTLVVVDEAHVYCPQKGEAESAGPVIDLATRGRKRGFCPILATQRLAKLHKDAAAECNNKLIGRTALDVDMDRAGDELGLKRGDERNALRRLRNGEFYAFGPALTESVKLVTVGPIQTTHPKAGGRLAFTAPPPTAKIKALLPSLGDLPAEAEQRTKNEAELRQEITALKRQLAARPTMAPAKVATVEKPILKEGQIARFERAVENLRHIEAGGAETIDAAAVRVNERYVAARAPVIQLGNEIVSALARVRNGHGTPRVSAVARPVAASAPRRAPVAARVDGGVGALPLGERRVLIAIAQHEAGVTREQVTILTGYKRSTRDAYIQRLRERGFVEISDDLVLATAEGIAALGSDFEPLPVGDALRAYWLGRLPEGERRVLEAILPAYPSPANREAISEVTGYKRSTRDAYIQRLGTRRLVKVVGRGDIVVCEELFG